MEAIKHAVEKVTLSDKKDKPEKPEKGAKKEKKPKKEPEGGTAARPLELTPEPDYIQHRIKIFDKLKAQYDEDVAKKPREDIKVALGNGRIEIAKSWETTPNQIARQISKSLFERIVIAQVDGELWDLDRPLEKDCKLELLDFEHPEGKKVFWHSAAHILGEAAERRFGCHLCLGPPTDEGFFYEMGMTDGSVISTADYKPMEQITAKIVSAKQPFERLVLSKTDLLEMFNYNKYKTHLISTKIPDGSSTTVYRCGPLIDLCRGPHVPNTGRCKVISVLKNSASYFLGDANNDSLQRLYGIAFPDKKQMEEHKKYLEEAAQRDHRKIGQQQELFFFHELSPGSCFFLPHGTRIYNALQKMIREEYWLRDYEEVITPNMFNAKLWQTSGHWQNYREDMFTFDLDKEPWALKPMNCPGHCMLFKHREHSYRDLPWRVAEFGVLHRNEASGALSGLTRVRRFVQDDTHIFCTQDQIIDEISGLFDFLQAVYGKMGFTFKLKLSTRPEKFLGQVETWDNAEAKLKIALDNFTKAGGAAWELNPGDGAFYGPKIDITIQDALRRDFQCATIQLDFQLPQQFALEYVTAENTAGATKPEDAKPGDLTPGCARPVMIHRAIVGSFERFIGILTEHFAGKWPFWLSPRQVLVIPVMPAANDYALDIQKQLRKKEIFADADISGETFKKKIRNGQLSQYNFMFIVGAEEEKSKTVNIRNRDVPETQTKGDLVPLAEAIEKLVALRDERRKESTI